MQMRDSIEEYITSLPEWAWPNFQLGNHDHSRAASRFGEGLVDAMNMIAMLLPGTPITYYGEELGMRDANLANTADSRDPFRTPMQWNNRSNAGMYVVECKIMILNVNPDSVKRARNRLRNKLEIGPEIELKDFLKTL